MYERTGTICALTCLCSLFLSTLGRADSADPLDDTAAGGTLITPETTAQWDGPHTLDGADTDDWFRIVMTAGFPYQIESLGASDTKAFLYADPDGTTQLAADDQGGTNNNFRLVYVPTETATNYLKVQAYPVGFDAEYTLQYSIYAADQWDPYDNDGATGTLLTMSEVIKEQGPHRLDQYDEYDWFRIQLTADVTYRFESLDNSDTYGELYSDPQGNMMVMDDDDSGTDLNFSFDFTPTNTATYYLRIWTYDYPDAQYDLRYHPQGAGNPDVDGDGMPDDWEILYFGSTNELSSGNWDNDYFLNGEEYIAGTDPTDPASYFAITIGSTGSSVIEWPAFSNRQYQVFKADSLTNPFSPISGLIYYPQNSYTDPSSQPSGFYTVEVQLQ